MGRHRQRTRTATYVAGALGAAGLAVAVTGSAAADDPITPLTCLLAPGGPECEQYQPRGVVDVDVDSPVCADVVVIERDGGLVNADLDCRPDVVPVVPVVPRNPVDVVVVTDDDRSEAPAPAVVDADDVDDYGSQLPIVNG